MRTADCMPRGASKAKLLPARFELVPVSDLLPHEKVDSNTVASVEQEIRAEGAVLEPILVADGSLVVLNGHHRLEVLRKLGARKVPAWIIDYHGSLITVDLWPGTSVKKVPSKKQIESRARKGLLYPPKTSRHTLRQQLPRRRTPLEELY